MSANAGTTAEQTSAVADPTERQLVAYNARDVESFVACFSEEVVVEDALGARILTGREELASRYGPMFAAHPDLACAVVSRIRVGDFVIHEEQITGRRPAPEHVVAIYRVADARITHVRFLR